ncbi:MAG: PEP-CTERM sorting domain-containing protein [Planctomycetota bacterium]|jgi:hypothetical protein
MKRLLLIAAFVFFFVGVFSVSAEIILETATFPAMTSTGGVTLTENQLLGARFHLDHPVDVTAIGGYMLGIEDGTFFGAILSLEDSESAPIGEPFDSSEVVASTLFTLPTSSYFAQDHRFALSTQLPAGDYALVFGSGQLGASGGVGAMPWMTNPGTLDDMIWTTNWGYWDSGGYSNLRFVIEGTNVPEPATLALLAFGGLLFRKRI